jgi:hypothetical protein
MDPKEEKDKEMTF